MNPDGDLFVKLLVLAVLIGQVVNVWLGIARRRETRRIEPQPLEIVAAEVYATKGDLARIEIAVRDLQAKRDTDVASLRAEIGNVATQIAALSASSQHITAQLATVAANVHRLAEQRAMGAPHIST